MINFNFVSPTKIYFGKGREDELVSILNEYGYKRVLSSSSNKNSRTASG